MRKGTKQALRWIFWSAGVVAFVLVLRSAAPGDALPIILAVGPAIALALIPYLGQIALDALAWRTLLGAIERKVSWRRLIAVRLSSEAVLMSVPGGSLIGESLKPYLLSRSANVPIADTVATIGVKRSLLAGAQALYLTAALLVGHELLARASHAVIDTSLLVPLLAIAAATLALVAVGMAAALFHARIAERVLGLLARIPWQRLRTALEARRAGFHATDKAFAELGKHRGKLLVALLLLCGAWAVEAVETGVLCWLLGIPLSWEAVLAMEAAVVLARNLAFFLPAGLGVQDAGYLAFLGSFGVASAAATAFVILKRTKELVWIAIGYVTLFVIDRRGTAPSAVTLVAPGGTA